MLTHSLPLPLVIEYCQTFLTAGDQTGIILALWHCGRVRRFRLRTSSAIMKELIVVTDDKFPTLELLRIVLHSYTILALPMMFQEPQLHHLVFAGLASPVGSSPLTAHMALVTFTCNGRLICVSELLRQVSLTAHLENLIIEFHFPVSEPGPLC